jgi:peptidyl-tRNA hydrolase
MHESRRVSLEQEGLLYTLTDAAEVDIPEQILASSRTLLQSIVAARAALDDQEAELAEKRGLFKLRLETVQRKAAAAAASEGKESEGGPSMVDLARSDEKLAKLDRAVQDCDEKVRAAKVELSGLEDEYRRCLTKIATMEAKQRKLFLIGKDAAGLEKLNKAAEWAGMRRDMDADQQLAQTIATIHSNTDTQKHALQGSDDLRALREAALQTMDSLREATETVSTHRQRATECAQCRCKHVLSRATRSRSCA